MQSDEKKFSIFAYRSQVSRLRQEIVTALRRRQPYDISRFFTLLPLNPANSTTGDRFVARGKIEHRGTGIVFNTGPMIDAVFTDDAIGQLAVFVPAKMQARFAVTTDSFDIEFQPERPVVTLYDLPLAAGYDKRFNCLGVSVSTTVVVWRLATTGTPAKPLRLVCALTPPAAGFIASALPNWETLAGILAQGDKPCLGSVVEAEEPCSESGGKWSTICDDAHGFSGPDYRYGMSECEADRYIERHKREFPKHNINKHLE